MRSGLENMRAAIFDLDGTLLDSLHIWEDIDEEFLQKRGLAVPEGYCEAIASMGFLDAADYAKKRFGFPESPDATIWQSCGIEESFWRWRRRFRKSSTALRCAIMGLKRGSAQLPRPMKPAGERDTRTSIGWRPKGLAFPQSIVWSLKIFCLEFKEQRPQA